MQTVLDRHIGIDDTIRGGKPCLVGTRMMHLHLGQSLEQIAGHYAVSLASLHAAMAYYYDHQADMDRLMLDEDTCLQTSKEATPSLLQAKLRTLGPANQ